jgi:hypothetical protein
VLWYTLSGYRWCNKGKELTCRIQSRDLTGDETAIGNATRGRYFLVIQKGYIGLGPGLAQKGDKILVLLGGSKPYVIKPKRVSEYKLLGESYVHRIMHEALKAYVDSRKEFKVFDLA